MESSFSCSSVTWKINWSIIDFITIADHLLLAPDAVLEELDPLLLVPVLLLTQLEQRVQGRRGGGWLRQDGPGK